MRPRHSFISALPRLLVPGVIGFGSLTFAQSVDLLVREGEPVIGLGTIQTIQNLVINNNGGWLVLADTDAAPSRDYAVLRQGFPAIGESDPVAAPQGATVGSLTNSNWRYDDTGNILWSFNIDGDDVTNLTNACLYWNTRLLARERQLVNADSGNISPETFWKKFYSFDFAGPDRVIAICELDDPMIQNASDDAVAEIRIDEFGFVLETHILMVEGELFPVDLDPTDTDPMIFEGFAASTNFHFAAVNKHGDFIWGPETTVSTNQGYMLINFDTIVARMGQVFSAPGNPDLDGRSLANFSLFEADINDFGDYFHTAGLNGSANTPLADTNAILMLNGEVYIQEGQSLASLNGATIGNTTNAPLYVSNSRDTYWVADLRNTLASEDVAFMRNKEVILRKGQDFVDDFLVQELRTAPNAISVSKDGRFWIGEVILQGSLDAALMIDFGLALERPGCFGNPGKMSVRSGKVIAGDQLRLNLDDGQAPGVTTLMLISGREPVGGDCGAMTPFGELHAVAPYAFIGVGPTWVGPTAIFDLDIPNNIALVDTTWYAQAMFLDLGMTLPGEDIRLTNGMKLEIGAP